MYFPPTFDWLALAGSIAITSFVALVGYLVGRRAEEEHSVVRVTRFLELIISHPDKKMSKSNVGGIAELSLLPTSYQAERTEETIEPSREKLKPKTKKK